MVVDHQDADAIGVGCHDWDGTTTRTTVPLPGALVTSNRPPRSATDLDRFLLDPEDIVVAVGQDGLVANVAKYVQDQPVIGVNPEPDRNPGVLADTKLARSRPCSLALSAAGRISNGERWCGPRSTTARVSVR
jgi:hypothetical protein